MAFMFGGEADNHAVNTVPKETLVRIVKAEDGGRGGKGPWDGATSMFGPQSESPRTSITLLGNYVRIEGATGLDL